MTEGEKTEVRGKLQEDKILWKQRKRCAKAGSPYKRADHRWTCPQSHACVLEERNGCHAHAYAQSRTYKAVLNRLPTAIGHLESIKKMVENGRDCSEVLIQLSAVKAAINNTGKVILQDHIQHCLVDAIESETGKESEELNKAIDRFIK